MTCSNVNLAPVYDQGSIWPTVITYAEERQHTCLSATALFVRELFELLIREDNHAIAESVGYLIPVERQRLKQRVHRGSGALVTLGARPRVHCFAYPISARMCWGSQVRRRKARLRSIM